MTPNIDGIESVRELEPGYFAIVMATGILATTCRSLDLIPVSWLLLLIAAVAYLVLVGLNGARLVYHRPAVVADLNRPDRSFGFFAFVAGTNVLSVALLQAGLSIPASVLAPIGIGSWIFITYALSLRLILAGTEQSSLQLVSGGWLLWVVATQSVASLLAVAAISGGPLRRRPLAHPLGVGRVVDSDAGAALALARLVAQRAARL